MQLPVSLEFCFLMLSLFGSGDWNMIDNCIDVFMIGVATGWVSGAISSLIGYCIRQLILLFKKGV